MNAIVSLGVGKWCPRGLDRLEASLLRIRFDGKVATWRTYPPGSKTHEAIPYGFKAHAISSARDGGAQCVLWLDSSVWAIRSLDPLFERIERDGYLLFLNGWSIGQFCKDEALPMIGMTREEAMKIPLPVGGAFGVNFAHPDGKAFFDDFYRYATDGVTFPGPWTNERGQASSDPRVLGHRHDQVAMAEIIHRRQLIMVHPPRWFAYWSATPSPITHLVARGMRGDETDEEVREMLDL